MQYDAKIIFDITRQDQIYIEEQCQKNSLTMGKFLSQLLESHRGENNQKEQKVIKKKKIKE